MSIDPQAHGVGTGPGGSAYASGDMQGTETVAQPRRTAGDIVAGVLLIMAGVFILGTVAVATVVSVVLLGWTAVIAGAILLVSDSAHFGRDRWLVVMAARPPAPA